MPSSMFHLNEGKQRVETEEILPATPPHLVHAQLGYCTEWWCFTHISSPIAET